MALKINDKAPDFSLPSSEGGVFTLSKNMANKPCVLYFYPQNFTKTCTAEACEFRNHFEEFRNLGVSVVGVSQDSVESHLKFKKAYNLPFELLADEKGEILAKYDSNIFAIGGLLGLSKRVTYLLDSKHQILAVYEGMFEAKEHVISMLNSLKKSDK